MSPRSTCALLLLASTYPGQPGCSSLGRGGHRRPQTPPGEGEIIHKANPGTKEVPSSSSSSSSIQALPQSFSCFLPGPALPPASATMLPPSPPRRQHRPARGAGSAPGGPDPVEEGGPDPGRVGRTDPTIVKEVLSTYGQWARSGSDRCADPGAIGGSFQGVVGGPDPELMDGPDPV